MNKKILIPGLILVIALTVWYLFFNRKKTPVVQEKAQAITVSKHNEAFDKSLESVMTSYFTLTEAFVNWDDKAINETSLNLKNALDSLKISEIQKDTLIYESASGTLENVKVELSGLIAEATIDKKREEFNMVSQNLYDFLRTIRYDGSKLYFQECPMAFDDEKPGNWLSKTADVRNPYLGTKHPKYKSGMLKCGGPRDTLNFVSFPVTQ
ncbi:MAG TPA: DUF3347 domain-containing protein [Chitinophagaceae bacterium]|nr:DUF3347 domain-containing protein [Chitinophagaceae bacterium]